MKLNISQSDKRMLFVLALFFALLGYYYLAFEPLSVLSSDTAKALDSKRRGLALQRVKVCQMKSWRDYCERLRASVSSLRWSIVQPPSSAPVPARIDALMAAATKAGVEIDSLKPVPTALQTKGQDGKPLEVTDRFVADGSCSFPAFLSFAKGLCGMKLEQFAVSSAGENASGRVRFHVVVSSLPAPPSNLPVLPVAKTKLRAFVLDQDLFLPKISKAQQEAAEAQAFSSAPSPSALAASSLDGVALFGVAFVDGVGVAVVFDPLAPPLEYPFLRRGDKLRGFELVSFEDSSVVFRRDGTDVRLRLPESPKLQEAPAPKARLGLQVHVLDPAYASSLGLAESSGLLVLAGNPGGTVLKGDVIKSIAGTQVLSIEDALRVLQKFEPGDTLPLVLFRDGREIETQTQLE